MARLRITFRGAETTVSLRDRETTIGRSNRCTIHLPDPDLAPVHFRIRQRDRGFQLKDDGSGAGTRVNGKPVYATTLRHGDRIEAGGLQCVFLAEASASTPAPAEPEVPVAAPAEPRGYRTSSRSLYLWAAVGALVCVVAAYLLLKESPEKEAHAQWSKATAVRDAAREDPVNAERHLLEARALLEEITERYADTRTARTAATNLAEVRRTLDALERLEEERGRLRGELDEIAVQDAFVRLARIREVPHPAVTARAVEVEEQLQQARTARHEREFVAVRDRAAALAEKRRYSEALRAWRQYETADYLYRQRANDARAEIEKEIAEQYRGLLRLAGRGEDLDSRIALLEASRGVFGGTAHAEDLEVRIGALRARKRASVVVVRKPEKKKEAEPEETEPEETEPEETEPEEKPAEELGPYEEPPKVAELVRQRRYAKAATTLRALSRHPDARIRLDELALLANLMADLKGAVRARPDDFTGVLLPHGTGRGDAVGADDMALKVRVDGTETQFAWEALPAKGFPKLFRQAGLEKPPRLATALFFDEEGLSKEARRDYVAFHRSEQEPERLTRILARRRGIEPPEKGFVFFRGDLVTEAERERTLLLERIEKLGKIARSPIEKRRRAAWAELETLGEPAVETLATVLRERRAEVAKELSDSRAFSASRFAARLGRELQERRKNALAFILDANKYPYPNKSEEAQKEAERLVDLVRALWDRPYEALLEKSEDARALDAELKELDQKLARLDPLGEPLYDATVGEIQKELDVSRIAVDSSDKKRIEYNAEVALYNAKVETTADAEERANVVAVNEYRHMMGQYALKIDERLVRAARKHSIEMRQLNYFDHNSPTKHLRTPNQRAAREGYKSGVAENIARGAGTGRQAFWQWFKSSGHHRNMLNPGHTEMGCGAAAHHWWTQKFGRATGRRPEPPDVPPDPDPPGQSGNGQPAPE